MTPTVPTVTPTASATATPKPSESAAVTLTVTTQPDPTPTSSPARATAATAHPTATLDPVKAALPCKVGQIKGNKNSMIYHVPDGAWYAITSKNVVCFDTEEEAQAAGYRRSKR